MPVFPPQLESKIVPVSGDFVVTLKRLLLGALEPLSGPVASISRFSGLNGSTDGPTSS
jgi:hypothetical protein